eukprot:6197332-Pleurochrysis_carterae.AAC.2
MQKGGCARRECIEPPLLPGRRPTLARNSLHSCRQVTKRDLQPPWRLLELWGARQWSKKTVSREGGRELLSFSRRQGTPGRCRPPPVGCAEAACRAKAGA